MEEELKHLVFKLASNNVKIGTVEQCTCGLLGASFGSICGCQGNYKGTLTLCEGKTMESLLNVSETAISAYTIVSSQVAAQLALNGLNKLNVDMCISIVGFVPNGSAWVCSALRRGKEVTFKYERLSLRGTRGENVVQVLTESIKTAIKHLEETYGG